MVNRAFNTTPTERLQQSLLLQLAQKRQEQWEKTVNFIDLLHTPATRFGAPSTNLLAGMDAPTICAPFHQTPLPCNSWRIGHRRWEPMSPPCLSTRYLTYGRKALTPEGGSISDPFRSEELATAPNHLDPGKSPGLDSILLDLYSMPDQFSNPGYMVSSLPACANSKFPGSGEEH